MLQGLLAERFKLKVHFEPREHAVYALAVSNGGPKLRESAPNAPPQGNRISKGYLDLHNTGIKRFVDLLTAVNATDRPIIDTTELTGNYDITLKWQPDDNAADQAIASSGSLFTEISDQLGLKLEATKVPINVLVIDDAQKPESN
jgi:uncharacterized protein (TIGR03435 family)